MLEPIKHANPKRNKRKATKEENMYGNDSILRKYKLKFVQVPSKNIIFTNINAVIYFQLTFTLYTRTNNISSQGIYISYPYMYIHIYIY